MWAVSTPFEQRVRDYPTIKDYLSEQSLKGLNVFKDRTDATVHDGLPQACFQLKKLYPLAMSSCSLPVLGMEKTCKEIN